MTKSRATMLAAILIVVLFVQLLGYWATDFSMQTWYPNLKKPAFTPPKEVFGPVWTILYVLMALSLWLVWKTPTEKPKRLAYLYFWGQLGFNLLWSFAFFVLQSPFFALIDIFLLIIFLACTINAFVQIHKLAAILLFPYFFWTLYALALNITIWNLNRLNPP